MARERTWFPGTPPNQPRALFAAWRVFHCLLRSRLACQAVVGLEGLVRPGSIRIKLKIKAVAHQLIARVGSSGRCFSRPRCNFTNLFPCQSIQTIMASGAGVAFAGALQASLSVLLTIGVGVVSAQYGLMSIQAAEDMSHLCVQVLLPCLLVVNLGENLDLETAKDYVPLISKLQQTSTGDLSSLWDRPLTKPSAQHQQSGQQSTRSSLSPSDTSCL